MTAGSGVSEFGQNPTVKYNKRPPTKTHFANKEKAGFFIKNANTASGNNA